MIARSKGDKPSCFKVLGKVHSEHNVVRSVSFYCQLSSNAATHLGQDQPSGTKLSENRAIAKEVNSKLPISAHDILAMGDFVYSSSQYQELVEDGPLKESAMGRNVFEASSSHSSAQINTMNSFLSTTIMPPAEFDVRNSMQANSDAPRDHLPSLPQSEHGKRSSLLQSVSGKEENISESAQHKAAAFLNVNQQMTRGKASDSFVTPLHSRENSGLSLDSSHSTHELSRPIPFPALTPLPHAITPSPLHHSGESSAWQMQHQVEHPFAADAARFTEDQLMDSSSVGFSLNGGTTASTLLNGSNAAITTNFLLSSRPPPAAPSAGQHRKSSLFQKASGGDVIISDVARRKAEQFMSSDAQTAGRTTPSNSVGKAAAHSPFVPPVSAYSTSASALTPWSADMSILASSTSSGVPSSGRKSSLLQKASGGDVVISDSARQKASQLLTNDSIPVHPVGAIVGGTAYTSSSSYQQPPVPVPLSAAQKKSSLLQKASGGDVFISDQARAKAENFISSSGGGVGAANVIGGGIGGFGCPTATVTPQVHKSSLLQTASGGAVLISDAARQRAEQFINNSSTSLSDGNHAAPSGTVPVVTPNVGPSRKSSLFQKASGGDVIVSDEARQRAEKFLNQPSMYPPASHVVTPNSIPTPLTSTSAPQSIARPPMQPPKALESSRQQYTKPPATTPANKSVTFAATPQYFPQYDHDLYQSTQDLMVMAAVSLPSPMPPPPPPSSSLSSSAQSLLPYASNSYVSPPPTILTPCLSRASLLAEDFLLYVPMNRSMHLQYLKQFNSGNLMDFVVQQASQAVDMNAVLQRTLEACGLQTAASKSKEFVWIRQQLLWVLWTYISYERRCPGLYQYKLLTLDTIVTAVQYRFSLYNCRAMAHTSTHPQLPAVFSNDDIFAQRRSAAQHFSQPGRMSSLQRCTDIRTWIAPMCLCLSISPLASNSTAPSSTASLGVGANNHAGWLLKVSDGWWWVKVAADSHVISLINRGKLHDGDKVIIFAASFPDAEAAEACIQVQINAVRKAHKDVRLGYVHPSHLTRGLSLVTLKEDGGPVFALRFKIIRLFPSVLKLRLPAFYGSDGASGFQTIVLSRRDADVLMQVLDELREGLMMSYRQGDGSEEEHTAKSSRKRKSAVAPAPTLAMEDIEGLLTNTRECNDVLVRDERSGKCAWLRVPVSRDEDGSSGGGVGGGKGLWKEGWEGVACYLTLLKGSATSLPTLTTNRNSSLEAVDGVENRSVAAVGLNDSTSGLCKVYFDGVGMQDVELARLFRPDSLQLYLRGEVEFSMQIVDWFVEGADDEEASAGHQLAPLSLQIFGRLCAGYGVMLRLPMLRCLVRRLKWLQRGTTLQVSRAVVRGVDGPVGMLHLVGGERTTLSALSPTPKPALSAAPTPTPARSAQKRARVGEGGKFQTPSRSSANTRACSNVGQGVDLAVEEERARVGALRQGAAFYSSALFSGTLVSVARAWEDCVVQMENAAGDPSGRILVSITGLKKGLDFLGLRCGVGDRLYGWLRQGLDASDRMWNCGRYEGACVLQSLHTPQVLQRGQDSIGVELVVTEILYSQLPRPHSDQTD